MASGFADLFAAGGRIRGTILERIGNTPVVDLSEWAHRRGVAKGVTILAKLEGFNPGGSVKDRAALSMTLDGLARGCLEGRTLLDSTSGNTGIAYAMIGAALGFPVKLCLPSNASRERIAVLKALGAELVLTDPLEGSDGSILVSDQIADEEPERYWKPDQYNNPSNPRAHALTTAPEILEQTRGEVSHVFASIGTSGTAMGLRQGFDRIRPETEVWSVEPDNALHGLEGLKHMASSIVPGLYDQDKLDGKVSISTEDAYKTVHELSRRYGLMMSPSGAAALLAAAHMGRSWREGTLVAIIPDRGTRYLTTGVWTSEFANGGGL